MDPISDIFGTMQIRAVVHARLEATAPWGLVHTPAEADEKAKDLPISPSELAFFGMIARGNCWLGLRTCRGPPLRSGLKSCSDRHPWSTSPTGACRRQFSCCGTVTRSYLKSQRASGMSRMRPSARRLRECLEPHLAATDEA
jgi:Cupin